MDCSLQCEARINGAIISLIDARGKVFDTRDVGVAVEAGGRRSLGVTRRLQTETAIPHLPIQLPFVGVPMGSYLSVATKVKIQLSNTDYLHLSEVQVFDQSGVNRALNKPTTMSSIYDSSTSDESSGMAVDGITTGVNFFQTDIEFGAWWEVELDPVHVKQVVIFNRQDCVSCLPRLSNAVVSLIDITGKEYDHKNVGNTEGVSQIVLNFEDVKKSVLPPKELEDVSCCTLMVSLSLLCLVPLTHYSFFQTRLVPFNTLVMDGVEIPLSSCMII